MWKITIPVLCLATAATGFASETCTRISKIKTVDDAAAAKFRCVGPKKRFLVQCDLSIDPVEFGHPWLDIKSAKWSVQGENKGLEGPFGFLSCEMLR